MYCPSNRRQKCNAFVSKKWWILITLSQVCGTVSWPNSISVKEHQTAFWLEKKNPAKYCLPGKKKKIIIFHACNTTLWSYLEKKILKIMVGWGERLKLLYLISSKLCWNVSLRVTKIMKHDCVYHLKRKCWHIQIVILKLNSKQLHIHKREYPSEKMMAYIYMLKVYIYPSTKK